MKTQDFIKKLAANKNVKISVAEDWYKDVLESIFEVVEDEGAFRTSFGTFSLKTSSPRPERMGRNPKTGEAIKIPATPAKKKITFTISKSYKEELNS